MSYPLEAVPNFSEGRDAGTIEALSAALGAHARLLDVHSDSDHNRSVFTLAGSEAELMRALLAGIALARERIDLRAHSGVHPCVGGTDVVPLVAVRPQDMEQARAAALELARRIGVELELPVFLYGELAGGRTLADLRRGGAEVFAERLAAGELAADFGPAELDPKSGAVLVGARRPLVAFNINLRGRLEAAREVAKVLRESGGGFPGLRALGLELPRAGLVQVSMNIENWQLAPLDQVVARTLLEAKARGLELVCSELVGLIPAGAVPAGGHGALRLPALADRQILESRLRDNRSRGRD